MTDSQEDINHWAYRLAYAAHEYYHGSQQSPLNDAQYEALVTLVRKNWTRIPQELKIVFESPENIHSTGMHIKLDDSLYSKAESYFTPHELKLAREG